MSELLELATSVVAQARAGEGVEVYVTRGTDTEVRAYEGEIESLTSADSSGVGIRVLVDGPGGEGSQVGFAWAGSLDPAVIAATLADARDNARFATPDPDVVLAVPDGVAAGELDLWDDGVAATPMEKKVALAVELERATRAADPRVRQVSSADYADSRVEVALVSTTGISSCRRRTNAFLSVDAIAGQGAETQTGTGFSVGRGPGELVPDEAMDDAVLRATRMLGAQKASSAHCIVVFDPRVVSTLLAVVASALSGEAVVKGRSFFAGRIGEAVADGRGHAGRRPDRPAGLRRLVTRRRGAGVPSQRPHLRRDAADVRLRHGFGSPGRDGVHRDRRCAAGSPGRLPRAAAPSCSHRGTAAPTRSWPPSGTASTCSR